MSAGEGCSHCALGSVPPCPSCCTSCSHPFPCQPPLASCSSCQGLCDSNCSCPESGPALLVQGTPCPSIMWLRSYKIRRTRISWQRTAAHSSSLTNIVQPICLPRLLLPRVSLPKCSWRREGHGVNFIFDLLTLFKQVKHLKGFLRPKKKSLDMN